MEAKTLTGILEWPARAEGRIRQMGEGLSVCESADDPFVPLKFGDELPLRNGLEVTARQSVIQTFTVGRAGLLDSIDIVGTAESPASKPGVPCFR